MQTYMQQSILRPKMQSLNLLARWQAEQFHFTLSYIHQLFSYRPEIPCPDVLERLQQPLVFSMSCGPAHLRPPPSHLALEHLALERRPDEDKRPTKFTGVV